MNNEIWVYDDKGEQLKNFLQLQDGLPYNENELIDNKHVYKFDNGYIKSENFGNVKIIGVHLFYDTLIEKSVWVTDSENNTKAVLKNASTGDIEFVKK